MDESAKIRRSNPFCPLANTNKVVVSKFTIKEQWQK